MVNSVYFRVFTCSLCCLSVSCTQKHVNPARRVLSESEPSCRVGITLFVNKQLQKLPLSVGAVESPSHIYLFPSHLPASPRKRGKPLCDERFRTPFHPCLCFKETRRWRRRKRERRKRRECRSWCCGRDQNHRVGKPGSWPAAVVLKPHQVAVVGCCLWSCVFVRACVCVRGWGVGVTEAPPPVFSHLYGLNRCDLDHLSPAHEGVRLISLTFSSKATLQSR